MRTLKITDKWNSEKVWVVKIYKCGTVYVNQEVKGKMLGRKFARMTIRQLKEIGVIEK